MQSPTIKARPRARRSRYRFTLRVTHSLPRLIAIGLVAATLVGGTLFVTRLSSFLAAVTNNGNPLSAAVDVLNAPPGSITYKLQHGQQVNILLLGYGGAENDAPYLTDSIMTVSIDPNTHRIIEASIPRDLWVTIDAWPQGSDRNHQGKINEAYQAGIGDDTTKLTQYQGRNGGGKMAEHVVSRVTGLQFDGYVGVDFVAFRDVVNALGGITVNMTGPLDDCHYPDYHNGYINGGVPDTQPCPNDQAGIHFKAGSYQVDGEQALEIARSRHASEPDQATDFGRARRQQMILTAIKHRVLSLDGLLKILPLMNALQNNVRTDITAGDATGIYRWGAGLTDSSIQHVALTDQDFLDGYYANGNSCGPYYAYVLCPDDQSYGLLHSYYSSMFVPTHALAEHAQVTIANASFTSYDLGDRLTRILSPLGLNLSPNAVRHDPCPKSYILDNTGGKATQTTAWLSDFFQAPVVAAPQAYEGYPGCVVAADGQPSTGVVVVAGRDFALRWYGLSQK